MNKQELQIMQMILEQLQMINSTVSLLTKKHLANLKETKKISRNTKTSLNESKQTKRRVLDPHSMIMSILNQSPDDIINKKGK